MKKILLVIFFMLLSFITVQKTAYAQSWQINSFKSQIDLQKEGQVIVSETIDVDFDLLEKHGIYRDIPYVYEDENNNKTYTEIKVLKVERNGSEEKFEILNDKNNLRIKIGEANKTISGKQTYTIEYQALGVLRSFDSYDELYWNVTGNYWEVPINYIEATVTLPENKIENTNCFEGQPNSTDHCLTQYLTTKTVKFSSIKPQEMGGGLTFAVAYTKGMVPILSAKAPPTFESIVKKPQTIISFLVFLTLGLIFILNKWWKNGRDTWFKTTHLNNLSPNGQEEIKPLGSHETIVVEYSPPEKLPPAIIGTLVDEKADTKDVTATIVDLAIRGYLTITEIPKKWAFGSSDYKLHKIDKNSQSLLEYEKELYSSLFAKGNEINVSDLKKTFYDDLAKVKKKLYEEVVSKKLFSTNPETIRNMYLGLGITIVVVGAVIFGYSASKLLGIGIGTGSAVFVCGLLVLVLHRSMGKRSPYGRELYRRTKGYYLFIGKAEKHRQKFFEDKNLFNEILPYAIVFGLVEKFSKATKDMGIKPSQPNWYSGTHGFNAAIFANNINSFSNSFSHAIAQTPSKGGGFSSGGSSGGGFGGGGGGSW